MIEHLDGIHETVTYKENSSLRLFVNTDCIDQCVNEACRRKFFKNPRIFFLLLFFSFLPLRFLLLLTDCKILIHFHAPFLFQ